MVRQNWVVLISLILCVIAAPCAHAFVDGGLKQTFGTNDYKGTYGFFDVGEDLHIKPYFNLYSSDTSSGTYKTFAARIGYDRPMWGVGVTIGGSPKTNGYSNRIFGIDGAVSIIPGRGPITRIGGDSLEESGPKGRGLLRLDLTGGITSTTHSDEIQKTSGGFLMRKGGAVNIRETDVNAGVGVSFLDTLASLDITKSGYDKDLAQLSARAAQSVRLANLASTIQGFPDTSVSARLDWSFFPVVTPFVSYTHTTFKIDQPAAKAVTVGAAVQLGMVEANASYENYAQNGAGGVGSRNYFTLGASLRF